MRKGLIVLLAAAVAAVLATSAGALIVPQHSIAGLKLGMTEKKVRALMGKPLAVHVSQNDFGTYRELVYPRVRASFQSGPKVTGLTTTSPKERTASGIGVGSTIAQVKAKLKGVRCKKEFGIEHCWLGSDFEPGTVVTDLAIGKGHVSRVTIGYVID